MKTSIRLALLVLSCLSGFETIAQQSPAITSWILNTNGTRARHYVSGNATPIQDTAKVNVQLVRYNATDVYVNASGLPSYLIGPYLDRNPAQGTNRNFVWRIPLNPVANTGTLTNVGMGQIAVLLNGVPIYNYADGRSYNNQRVWNQNAVYFENAGFDCAKGHPSPVMSGTTIVGGTYHHHQNPTAYRYEVSPGSTVCNLYTSDGLYVPDSTVHSPLIGYSFDGFPIYGGYGYANANGTGGIKRLKPSYRLKNLTSRTNGPTLATYPLGAYNEDFEFAQGSGDLDVHNGRFCVTPEYPNGIYCYFATIDAQNKALYPYFIGPTYYGVVARDNFPAGPNSTTPNSVQVPTSGLTTYVPTALAADKISLATTIYPNPADEFAAIQLTGLQRQDVLVTIFGMDGRKLQETTIYAGSTLGYLDTRALYDGQYLIRLTVGDQQQTARLVVRH